LTVSNKLNLNTTVWKALKNNSEYIFSERQDTDVTLEVIVFETSPGNYSNVT